MVYEKVVKETVEQHWKHQVVHPPLPRVVEKGHWKRVPKRTRDSRSEAGESGRPTELSEMTGLRVWTVPRYNSDTDLNPHGVHREHNPWS